MIEFYGSPMSSAGRTHWMLEEVGVAYDYKRIDIRAGQTRTPEFLRVYPGAKVPALRDGSDVIGESMAINFYLAEKYKPELIPADLIARGRVYQWSFWALTNLQPDLLTAMFDAMKPKDAQQPLEAERTRIAAHLAYLEQSLSGTEYLVDDRFSVADVNAGSVANLARAIGLLRGYPNASAWMERLAARPAYVRAAKE